MSMTDPIADMLSRIRNANLVYKPNVEIPYSNFKEAIIKVLKEEGYIKGYEVLQEGNKKSLNVELLYYSNKRKAITDLKKVSRPSLRRYADKNQIPKLENSVGISILSTPKGILSNRKAKELGTGGEIILYAW
jgi:small subunit ribosomal protein S8